MISSRPATIEVPVQAAADLQPTRVKNAGAFALAITSLALLLMICWILPTSLTGTPIWAGVVIAPLLIAISIPFLVREAKRQNDARLLWFLVAALLVKFLIGACLRRWVAIHLYGDRGDLVKYNAAGVDLSTAWHQGTFNVGGRHFVSTEFIEIFTGVVYTIIGPTLMGGFLFFSWLGFWGLFMMYRAFRIALPDQSSRGYARMLFFLPSLVYWPSSIGKEAFMLFVLGIAALGTAKFLSGQIVKGVVLAGLGLTLCALVRPHVAVFAGMGLFAAAAIRKPRAGAKRFVPFAKTVSLVFVGVIAAVLILRADVFLRESNIDTEAGLGAALGDVADMATQGGSEYPPPVVDSPSKVPIAVVTVLFRPFPNEAVNAESLFAALEGTLLLCFCIIRIRSIWAAARSVRRLPYVTFAWMYTALSIAALSTFGNFGILTRQRTLLYPVFFVLLFVKPVEKRRAVIR